MERSLKYALDYARHGWHVLPLTPDGKTPFGKLVPNGVKNATTDEKTIRKWFEKSKCNLGIATGPESKIWVLDIDGPVGALVWWDWEAKHGHVFSLAQRTGRIDGGRQIFFQYPDNYTIKTRANVMTGIDVRAENGYVLAPPSIHPSGLQYVWEGRIPINPAPEALLKIVATKRHPTTAARTSATRTSHSKNLTSANYGKAAVDELLQELSSCPRGGRNHKGYRVAVRLLELEASGIVEPGTAESVLREGLYKNGYLSDPGREHGENGLNKILNSARKKIYS